jgi:hypothetical protein
MQINPLPQPTTIGTNITPQAVSQALPQVQALAATPITKRAVTPPDKKEKSHKNRTNEERTNGGDEESAWVLPKDNRGHFVNTSA